MRRNQGIPPLVCACALVLSLSVAPSAGATVFTNTTIANFGSFGAGVCRGAAVGIGGYEVGQVVLAHPTGLIESGWTGKLQVTAVPGPAADQVGYKVCNISASTVSSPADQTIRLAAISTGSGQSTAAIEQNFGSIAADSCLSAAQAVPGAQLDAAVTAQPHGSVAAAFAAAGGVQVTALPGPDPDQITLKACNVTSAAINPPQQSFLLGSFPSSFAGAATNTSTLSYGQIGGGSCSRQSFGVPGAKPEDAVIASPVAPVGSAYGGRLVVTALSASEEGSDEGSYKVCNIGANAITPPSQNFRVMALHPPAPPCDPELDLDCGSSVECDPVLDLACDDPCAGEFLLADSCSDRLGPSCGGRAATIVGTRGADTLKGTKRRDVIAGLGGRDVIRGLGGNDLICGGNGNDKLLGGAGNDRLLGGRGADRLFGGKGKRDRCFGGAGKDRAKGCRKITKVP